MCIYLWENSVIAVNEAFIAFESEENSLSYGPANTELEGRGTGSGQISA
jgi:hypothetical protein